MHLIKEKLIAKPRKIKIHIGYDFASETLDPYKITIAPLDNPKAKVAIKEGYYIKPGSYKVYITQKAYKPIEMTKHVWPSKSPLVIDETLIATSRRLSFQLTYQGLLVPAHKLVNALNGQAISYKDKFKPGTKLQLLIQFLKYKTVTKDVTISPGNGPFVVEEELEPLTEYSFSSLHKNIELDGQTYNYVFYTDGKKMEDHLISVKKLLQWHFTVRVGKNATIFTAYAGYYYTPIYFSRLRVLRGLTNIDIPRLIEHLDLVAKKNNGQRSVCVKILEKILRTLPERKKLSYEPSIQIAKLVQAIESWKGQLSSEQDHIRIRVLVDELKKIKD